MHLLSLWKYTGLAFLWSVRATGEKDDDENSAPNYWGCQADVAKDLPYCDVSLSVEDRVADLVGRLTLEEKVAAISPQDDLGNKCMTHTRNVSRIGFPAYAWLVETNTMVASACLKTKCATQFAGPLSMAASFNRSSWYLKGAVLGTEQRALMNIHHSRGHDKRDKIALTAYGPNINQQRDPRFGRSSELPGEDPVLSGQYAAHMVQGMQEKDNAGYPKTLAYLKHFTAYSRETNRGHDTYNISMFDLFDTYLPQFQMAFDEGQATGVMCSYNGINGVPSCANGFLLQNVMRKKWNQPYAHITSDCGAVHNLLSPPARAPDSATAAAWALNNGTDIEMGSEVYTFYLVEAVRRGLTTEQAVDAAFTRSYYHHFKSGRFDNPRLSQWYSLGEKDVLAQRHQDIRLDAALQGIVLLKHDHENPVLPLKAGETKVAVLGPLGQERYGLMSDYAGDQVCVGGGFDCVPTLAESITVVNGKDFTTNIMGVAVDSTDTAGFPLALDLARSADVIVLCLGITKQQEREGVDRKDTALPGAQEEFARQVFATGKPVVTVFVNGGQVAMDDLVDGSAAVIEAFNPNSIGGTALAMLLFGKNNRWGKLPYTIYPYATMQSFDMENYDMSAPPGRTYRYFTGEPIFAFGYGLSLTRFEIDCKSPTTRRVATKKNLLELECSVTNIGDIAGDEVVQVYHVPSQTLRDQVEKHHPVPLRRLVDFARVSVNPGESTNVVFELDTNKVFSQVNRAGENVVYSGTHSLAITNGVQEFIEFNVEVKTGVAVAV